jgi:hypothetical protein
MTMKVLFGMALRQMTGFGESLLRLTGLDWDVPDFGTICRSKGPQSIALASRPKEKASGTLASMVTHDDVFGVRSTSVSTNRRWKSERSRSRAATPRMHRCYHICSTKARAISRSAA